MSSPKIIEEEKVDDMGENFIISTFDNGEVIIVPIEET
tara:strand:- start:446 stop:559 length:114 start_codon:yes stop_codon:yes gene_type:complete